MIEFGPGPTFADLLVGVAIGIYLLLFSGGVRLAARRGWARRALHAVYWVLLLYALELVIVAVWLLPTGGLWYALGAAGLVGTTALAVSGPRLWRLYDEADARRLIAQDCL